MFWELNFGEKKESKHASEIDYSKIVWKALFSIQLFKTEQSFFFVKGLIHVPPQRTELFIGTEEGELLLVNYNLKDFT